MYVYIYTPTYMHTCIYENFTLSDIACPDLDNEEEIEAQKF